tara:strand:- start:122 stop:541 length:420 start_codon:yes stop_codon:yes gene_type:complete
MVEKYLYFRVGGAAATEDDDATGSTYYPFSSLRGICSGTAAITGVVTDDDDAVSLFFTPKGVVAGGGEDQAKTNDVDVVVLACAQYGQKAVIDNLLAQMNHVSNDKNTTILKVFDGYVGNTGEDMTGVTGCTVLHASNA